MEDDGDAHARAVADEVSDVLLATDADLLSAVEALTPAWQRDLDAARGDARRQQAAILARRVDLRDAFAHGAKITATMAPSRGGGGGGGGDRDELAPPRPPSPISLLAAPEPARHAIALRNVSHTLHLLRFLEAAPELVKAAITMLDRVAEEAPESSDLFQAYQNICACVRVRDFVLLGTLPDQMYARMAEQVFAGLDDACEQLEHYLMANIFSAVPQYAQTDPRVLVAAVRIVELDREEDLWWEQLLQGSPSRMEMGKLVRPYGRRDYARRMHDAIVKSIQHHFRRRPSGSTVSVDQTLSWLTKLLAEEQEGSRFVGYCFPPSYEIADLFSTEYHREIMVVITDLFRATGSKRSTDFSSDDDEDLNAVKIVEWYRQYRWSSGAMLAASRLELPSGQRDRLVAAVARHGKAKLLAKVKQVLEMEIASNVVRRKPEVADAEFDRSRSSDGFVSVARAALEPSDAPGICTTAGPERVFGAISQQVKDARVLGVPAVNTALAKDVKLVLTRYQDGVRLMLSEKSMSSVEQEDHVCATANNMARCLEYSEELREAMSPFVLDESRANMEEEFEEVIEGFREIAGIAVGKLADAVSADATPARGFFAPRTGTEVMLDVISILRAYFKRYNFALIPFHYEVFAGSCLRHVATRYLEPFILLDQARGTGKFERKRSFLAETDTGARARRLQSSPELATEHIGDLSSGLLNMDSGAIVAQMDKDISNLFHFFKDFVKVVDKKLLDLASAAIGAVRDLVVCRPTTQFLAAAHANAVATVARLPADERGGVLRFPVGASEALWRARSDVRATTALEAGARIRRDLEVNRSGSLDDFDTAEDMGAFLMWRTRRAIR